MQIARDWPGQLQRERLGGFEINIALYHPHKLPKRQANYPDNEQTRSCGDAITHRDKSSPHHLCEEILSMVLMANSTP